MFHFFRNATLAVLFLLAVSTTAFAESASSTPQSVMKSTIDKVITIVNDKALKAPDKVQERRAKIRAIFDERFDMEEMSKRALSVNWTKRTEAEKKEFIPLFSNLIINAYIGKIEKYSGETVNYLDEHVDDSYSEVKTEVNAKDGKKIPIEYHLLKENNDWKVYDVSIEGVRLVNNYRSQFTSIINNKSYGELVKLLREKKAGSE